MAFGKHHQNKGSGYHQPNQSAMPPSYGDELNALNQLGGVNDLEKNSGLKNIASGAKDLNKDLNHLQNAKTPNQAVKAVEDGFKDANKVAPAAQGLSGLNDFTNDLTKPDVAKTPMEGANTGKNQQDKNQTEKAEDQEDSKDPYAALNGIGDLGSLAKSGGDKVKPKDARDALKDINQLGKDLKHPAKIKDPLKDLEKGKNLAGKAGAGALGFGLLEGAKEQALADNKLDDKVANGSIRPSDLNSPLFDQQGQRKNRNPIPHDGWLGKLKRGARHAKAKVVNGVKSAFTHATKGIMSAFHGITGKAIAKATAAKIAAVSMAMPVLVGGSAIGYVIHDSNDYQVLDDGNVCAVANDNGSGFADAVVDDLKNAAGLNSKEQEKVAKQIFMFLVKKEGFGGAGAAGADAVAERESGFRADAKNAGGGVAGLFQWSGWSNTVNGDRIHQGGFIKSESDLTVSKELKLVDYELHHGYSKTRGSVGKESDPGKAAMNWSVDYEGVSASDGQTKGSMIEANAKKWYEKFHGSQYKPNDSLLGKAAAGAADDNSATAEQANNAACKNQNGNGGPVTSGNWGAPYPGWRSSLTSGFGNQPNRNWHDGVDLSKDNTPIHAIHGGRVVDIDTRGHSQDTMGHYIAIQSPDGYTEVYQEYAFSNEDGKRVDKVKVGDSVKTGQVITKMSFSTPNCTHIHIGIYHGSYKKMMAVGERHYSDAGYGWVNPEKMIK